MSDLSSAFQMGQQTGSALGNFAGGAIYGGKPDDPSQSPSAIDRLKNGAMSAHQGFADFLDSQRQLKSAGKAADYFRDALGDDAETETGIPDEQWDTLGSRDKASAISAYMQRQSAGQMQARTQALQAQALSRQDAEAEKANEAGGLARWAQSMDQQVNPETDPLTGEPMTEDASVLQQFSPAQRANLHALAGMGQSNPRLAAPMLKDLFTQFGGGGGGQNGGAGNFFPADPSQMTQDVPGFDGLKRIVLGPKSSVLRDKNGAVATMMTDEDGQPIGYSVPTGTGASRFVPKAQDKTALTDDQLLKHLDAQMKNMSTQLGMAPEERASEMQRIQDQMDAVVARQGKGKAAAPAAAAAGATAPAAAKTVTPDVASQYLLKFGGDKDKARDAAKKDGYTF